MKVARSATEINGRRPKISPPIPLERPEHKEPEKGEYQNYKLRNVPGDAASPTYELAVPYFSSGTPEEWLRFRQNVKRVCNGQNITTGAGKFAVARRLLEGDALSTLENATTAENFTETNPSFNDAMNLVARMVFPPRAVVLEKRYLRRFLRKPLSMKSREFASRVVEINNFIAKFPPDATAEAGATTTPTKLDDDELVDLMEFGCPKRWQREMVVQGFDPTTSSIKDFVAFCERMERVEVVEGSNNNDRQNVARKPMKVPFNNKKRIRNGNNDSTGFHCMLHGPNKSHNTENCTILKNQAKKM